jgi:3-demethoxyubiquinol 3-hydroxylase
MPERLKQGGEPRTEAETAVPARCAQDTRSATQTQSACTDGTEPITVWYDGACPLCRREIGVYRGLQARLPLRFADVSDAATALPEGASRSQLLARFHVRQADGRWLSGAPAFLAMWAVLPGWRWLAGVGRLPGAAWLMERAYRGFLRLRPRLQRWAARLDR